MTENVTVAVVDAANKICSQVIVKPGGDFVYVHDEEARKAARDVLVKLFKMVEA